MWLRLVHLTVPRRIHCYRGAPESRLLHYTNAATVMGMRLYSPLYTNTRHALSSGRKVCTASSITLPLVWRRAPAHSVTRNTQDPAESHGLHRDHNRPIPPSYRPLLWRQKIVDMSPLKIYQTQCTVPVCGEHLVLICGATSHSLCYGNVAGEDELLFLDPMRCVSSVCNELRAQAGHTANRQWRHATELLFAAHSTLSHSSASREEHF